MVLCFSILLILCFLTPLCYSAAWDHFVFTGAVICRYPNLKFSYHIIANEHDVFWDTHNTGDDEVRYRKLSPQFYNFTAKNNGEFFWFDKAYEVYLTVNHNCFNRATRPPYTDSLRARFDVGKVPVNGQYHYINKNLDVTDIGETWNKAL